MATRHDLPGWVEAALKSLGGEAPIVAVARRIWEDHHDELSKSGDLFFTWQYDIRWAVQVLRDDGIVAPAVGRKRLPWRLMRQP